MDGPSVHLSWAELACKDGTPYPDRWRLTRAVDLAEEFEAVRAACGDKPMLIRSAYRTPLHNAAVGGAPKSQHLEGRALDLRPPSGMSAVDLYRRIRQMHRPLIHGLGLYDTFVHMDIRPTDELVTWDLRTVKALQV